MVSRPLLACGLLMGLLCPTAVPASNGASAPSEVPAVIVDGRSLPSEPALARDGDRWLLPVAAVIRTLGGELTWDAQAKTLDIALPRRSVRCDLASGQILISGPEGGKEGKASPVEGTVRIAGDRVVATAEGLRRLLGARVEYRDVNGRGRIEITSAWSSASVGVADFLRWRQFFEGKALELSGEFLGWFPLPDQEATAQGPPRWWGDWIIRDETGAVYISGRFPAGLDPYDDRGRPVQVRGVGAISDSGIPYIDASEVVLPAAQEHADQ